MKLSEIQKIVFIEYKNNGYFDMWNYVPHNANVEQLEFMSLKTIEKEQKIRDIAELGLINTEVSEAIELVRSFWKERETINSKPIEGYQLENECSDIIIRTLNFMSRKGFNAEKSILHKNKINLNRKKLHGRGV